MNIWRPRRNRSQMRDPRALLAEVPLMLRTSAVVALALLVAEIAGADTLTSHDVTAFRKDDASSILDVTRRRLVLVGGEGYYYGPTPFIETLDLADPHP